MSLLRKILLISLSEPDCEIQFNLNEKLGKSTKSKYELKILPNIKIDQFNFPNDEYDLLFVFDTKTNSKQFKTYYEGFISKLKNIQIPIFIFSNSENSDFAIELIQLGFDDYFCINKYRRLLKSIERSIDKYSSKKAEVTRVNVLKSNEKKYRVIFEQFQDLYYQTDMNGNLIMLSPSVTKISGFSVNELIGKNVAVVYKNPDDRKQLINDIKKSGYLIDYEIELKHKDGSTKYTSINSHIKFDMDGTPFGIEGIIRDITKRKLAEQKLLDSEQRYKSVFKNTGTATVILESNSIISMANPEFEKLCGLSKFEIEGKRKWTEFVLEEDLHEMMEMHKGRRVEGNDTLKQYEFRFKRINGQIRNILLNVDIIKGCDKSVASLLDITEMKKTYKALKESEEKFRTIAENTPGVIYLYDIKSDGTREAVYNGPGLEKLLGKITASLTLNAPDAFFERIHPTDREKLQKLSSKSSTGNDSLDFEYRIKTDNNVYKWIRSISSSRKLINGNVRVQGLILDINELKETQETLIKREAYFRELVANIYDIIVIFDRNQIIKYCSPNIKNHFGWKAEELISKSGLDITHEDDREYLYQKINEISDSNKNSRVTVEFRLIKKDKTFIDVEMTAENKLDNPNIRGYIGNFRNITERKKTQQKLIEAQKMDTIGNLAGGLAHDFNNVLGGITGSVSIIWKYLSPGNEKVKKFIEIIEHSALRATDMVSQLLTLSRNQELTLAPIDLNYALKNVLKICYNTFDKSIEIKFTPHKSDAVIMGDPTRIEQSLLNILVNSSHAMTFMRGENEKQGGELTTSIENILADDFFCKTNPEAIQDKPYWLVQIRDTGVGINDEIKSQIFDPFFTTKEVQKGTGLGLAMVYNIVKQHNGFLDVYSDKGIGTTFNIFIPELESNLKILNGKLKEEESHIGSGLILIVDDEEIIREIGREILESCGYSVIIARNGREGIDLYSENRDKVKAVLLDMAMPKMSGLEAFVKLKEINPDLKILISSGFKQDKRVKEVMSLGADAFIQKPYTYEKLIKEFSEIVE